MVGVKVSGESTDVASTCDEQPATCVALGFFTVKFGEESFKKSRSWLEGREAMAAGAACSFHAR